MSRIMDRIGNRRILRWSPVGLMIAIGCAAAMPARAAERDDVRQALLAFFTALDGANPEVLRASIWASPLSLAQQAGRDEIVGLIVAHKRLERAAAARWPDQGRRLSCGFEMLTGELHRQSVESGRVLVEDPGRARIYCAGETGYVRLARGTDRWQVCLDTIERMDDDSAVVPGSRDGVVRIQLDRYAWMARGAAEIASRVEAGEFAAVTDAEAALAARWAEITTEVNKRRTALWERRFGRGG